MAKGAFPFPPKGKAAPVKGGKPNPFAAAKKGVNPFAAKDAKPAFKKGGMVKGKKGC